MYLKLPIITLLCLAIQINSNPTNEQPQPTIPFHNFTSLPVALADLQSYILHFNETHNFPSILFGFSVKGKTIFKKAYGISDLSNGIPANTANKYRLGSLSKSFTSAILGILVDQGLAHYDDLVYKYLDERYFPVKYFNGTKADITINQLLTHTGGIPATEPKNDFFTTLDPPANVTQQILLFKDQQLKYHPGTTFEYANNGYQVLGAIIESITKKSYQKVATEFLKKYKFPAALVDDTSQVIQNIPRYYADQDPKGTLNGTSTARSKDNFAVCPYDDLLFLNGWWPAGGLVATLDDLLRYGQLLINSYKGRSGSMLSKKTIAEIWTGRAHFPPDHDPLIAANYGYGWNVAIPNRNNHLQYRKMVYHSGAILGVTTHLMIWPDEEAVGVAFANKGGIGEEEMMVVYAMENLYHLVK